MEIRKFNEKELQNEISLLKSQNELINNEINLKNQELTEKNRILLENEALFKKIQGFFNVNEKRIEKFNQVFSYF